ncbi:MAG: HlyD family efflux transporter periplasmic adaptor subunit [Sedimentisphaerales bacterium]|nr:HlyD family efflux transporter periplasmic adaptor subunit [Sedimentisphaerales bacterium]
MGRMLPVIVWLAAVGGVVSLYMYRHRTFMTTGLAIARTQMVSGVDNGIIRHLPVQLHQQVRKGDLLAILELGSPPENDYAVSLSEAQKATAQAEVEHLKAELSAVEAQLRHDLEIEAGDQTMQYERLVLEVEQAQFNLLETRTTLELDRGLLASLELEKNASRELFDKQAIHLYELQKAELEYEAVARKIKSAETLELQARENLAAAQQRLTQYAPTQQEKQLLDTLLEPYRKAVAVQEKLLDELFTPPGQMMITAQIDGIVSSIYMSEGQGFQAGEWILQVSAPAADYVVAWLDPIQANQVHPQQSVEIAKHSVPRQVFRSEIISVSPAAELLPEQLWLTSTTPKWGRSIKMSIPPEAQLFGNEVVGIRGLK